MIKVVSLKIALVWLLMVVVYPTTISLAFPAHVIEEVSIEDALQVSRKGRALIKGGEALAGAELLQQSAYAYYSAREYSKAKNLYSELFDLKALPLKRRIAAGRMAGQALMQNQGNANMAQAIWLRILQESGGLDPKGALTQDPSLIYARGQAFKFLAEIHRERKEFEKAISMRNRLIEQCPNIPVEGLIASQLIENAVDYLSMGSRKSAVAEYDKYLEGHPDAGITVKHKRALAYGYKWGTDEHTEIMGDLWNDPQHKQDMWRYNVGRELLGSLVRGGKYLEAIRFGEELRRDVSKLTQAQLDALPIHIRDSIKTAHSECLFYLANSQLQSNLVADGIGIYQELISLFPDSPSGKFARNEIAGLLKGNYDISKEMLSSIGLDLQDVPTSPLQKEKALTSTASLPVSPTISAAPLASAKTTWRDRHPYILLTCLLVAACSIVIGVFFFRGKKKKSLSD